MKKQIIAKAGAAVAVLMVLSGCLFSTSENLLGDSGAARAGQRIVNFHVVGKGIAPETALTKGQAIILAEKAAVADGYRKLIEKIRGVYVDAYLKSGQGVVDYDVVQTHTQAWIRGAEVLEMKEVDHGITEAHMRLRINFTRKGMVWWPVGIDDGQSPGVSSPDGLYSSNPYVAP